MSPSEYITAKRYVNQIQGAVTAMTSPGAVNYFNRKWVAKGNNGAELVRHMKEKGLQFTAAGQGSEVSYRVLYNAFLVYNAGMFSVEAPVQPMPSRLGKRPPPKTERVLVGTYSLPDSLPSVLVHWPWKGDVSFKRLKPGGGVYSNETLVNLPGYTTEIETKTGVILTMRGNLPEFSINPLMDFLLDVEVVLHAAPEKIDLDLTLERGRIYLANPKDRKDVGVRDVVVRLRFREQVWDSTLQEGAEVGVDLIKKYITDIEYLGEDPRADLALCALQGKVQVTINGNHERKPAALEWQKLVDDGKLPPRRP